MSLFLDINNFLLAKYKLLEMKSCFTSRQTRINTFVTLNNNNLQYYCLIASHVNSTYSQKLKFLRD